MGFMDKAKKLADQAQAKLDDAQKQFNDKQSGGGASADAGSTPPIDYDQHGRAVSPAERSTPPHGDPTGQGESTQVHEQTPHHDAQTDSASPPHGDPLLDQAQKAQAPPPSGGSGMSGGDPLAG